MAWQIDYHHVDLDRMMHVTRFIEPGVKTIHGAVAESWLLIEMRTEPTLDAAGKPVKGELTVKADGSLVDHEGVEFIPKHRQQQELARLNAEHDAGRAFARRHGAAVFAGPKRK